LSSASKERYRLRIFNKDHEEYMCTETTAGWGLTTDRRLYLQYGNIKCGGVYKKGYSENRRMFNPTCGVTIQEYFGCSQYIIFLCDVESPHEI
jgi:hypothetical protein